MTDLFDLRNFHSPQGGPKGFDDSLYLRTFGQFIDDVVGPRRTMDQLGCVEVAIVKI